MARRNSDDSREITAGRHRLVFEARPELEQGRQLLVLALDLLRHRLLDGQALVLVAQGRVVDPQPIDLGDGRPDRRDATGHLVERALDRPEREARRRSAARARSGWRRTP